MGTKRYSETPLPGYYIMRDLNEDSSLSSWPLFYGDKTVTNGYYCNAPISGSIIDGHSAEDKHSLKQKMVEHEAVFKNQVCELHRLYRIQRDLMEHAQKKEQHMQRASVEPSCSSNIHGSQPEADARKKWHMAGFHLQGTGHNRTSVLGVEMSDSPVSCTKQDNTRPNWFPFRNGTTPRKCQAFESRPSKVRKKLLDLQLPADAYVDVEEGEEITVQKMSAYDLNHNPEPFYGNRSIERNHLAINGQASSSRSRSIFGFADLNEPVKNNEAAFDFLGSTSINGRNEGIHDKPIRSNAGYIGGADTTLDVSNGFLMKSYTQTKVSEKGWLSHINEAGSSKNSTDSLSQSCHPYNLPVSSSPTVQASLSQLHHGTEQYQTGSRTRDFRTDIHCHGLNSVARNHVPSYGNNMKPIAYCSPGSYSFFSSWAQSVPPLENPNDDVVQKMNAFESSSINSFKHLLPYPQNQEMKRHVKADPSLNGGYHESLSELNKREHLPFACFDYLNCNGNHYAASDQLTNHASGKIFGGFSQEDSKPGKVVNSKAVLLEDGNVMAENNGFKDHPSPLPWLNPKPNHRTTEAGENTRLVFSGESSYSHAASKHSCWKNERVRDLNHPGSSGCEILIKNDTSRRVQKIMGTPIFETAVPEIEPSSNISTSTKSTNNERKSITIDINVEFEPDESIYAEEPITEKESQKKNCTSIRGRDHIDLNSCASDFEDPPLDLENKSTDARLMIDLEAPASMESEDDVTPSKNEDLLIQSEVIKNAAEIMIAISSSCPQNHVADPLSDNSLLLFADAIISSLEEESTFRDESLHHDSSDDVDLFEAMTLQLEETKEEDYMPKRPSTIPQIEIVEDVGVAKLPNRPRRGQARRGRQRKDFQRDILPGMTSLSRHEVTEDIQTFGGLMKASGHSWHSRTTRKNGGARGRSRGTVVVRNPICTRSMRQKIGNGDACLDERSLTGWGKTTRRPRRQRWNHQTVVLTLDDAMNH